MTPLANRLVFGKDFNDLPVERRIRRLQITLIVLIVMLCVQTTVLGMSAAGSLYLSGWLTEHRTATEPVIDLSELTPEDGEIASTLLAELDPRYLRGHKSITFTYDVNRAYEEVTGRPPDEPLLGFNRLGQVYVEFRTHTRTTRVTLCHELLHTYFKSGPTAHAIIYALEGQDVCYA